MPENLLALIARLDDQDNALSDSELTELRTGLTSWAQSIADEPRTPEIVEGLTEAASTAARVDALVTERAEQAAELNRQADEALAALAPPAVEPATVEPVEAEPAAEPALVAAAPKPTAAAMNANRTPSRAPAARPHTEEPSVQTGIRKTLVAGLSSTGINQGQTIDMDTLAVITDNAIKSMRNSRGNQKVIVASVLSEYPEERRLSQTDTAGNERKLDAVLNPTKFVKPEGSLVASGGICAPLAADFTVPIWAETGTPLIDSLPKFDGSRGGVRYVLPPSLSALAAATSLWTAANDANPTNPTTKPLYTQVCATEQTVVVNAVPTRIKIGNMQGMFNPELTAANIALATAAADRFREVTILTAMAAGSVELTAAQLLGATPDLLAQVDQVASAMRYRQRLMPGTPLRVILPAFAADMMRADLARRLATDSSESDGGALAVPLAQLENFFAVRNINVTWVVDALPAQTTGNTYPLQGFAAQTTGAINNWPTQVVWLIYPEGSWQYIDGGRMDFGVIRDSVLDATNDYELMFEPFETVAYRGVESDKIISSVRPNGSTAATINTSTY